MQPIAPIALMQSNDLTRRALRGSGPDGAAVAERPRSRATRRRLARRAAAQSESDQCSIVAVRRNPARA